MVLGRIEWLHLLLSRRWFCVLRISLWFFEYGFASEKTSLWVSVFKGAFSQGARVVYIVIGPVALHILCEGRGVLAFQGAGKPATRIRKSIQYACNEHYLFFDYSKFSWPIFKWLHESSITCGHTTTNL